MSDRVTASPKAGVSEPSERKAVPAEAGSAGLGAETKSSSATPAPPLPPAQHRWAKLGAGILILAGAAGGGAYWWMHSAPVLPPGIVSSNGRLEADEIDIDTKFAGRIAEILVDEGDMLKEGQTVARVDTRDLAAELAQARAQTAQAQQSIVQDQANLADVGSQMSLSEQQLQRTRTLRAEGYATQELLDQRQSQANGALASYHAAEAQIANAKAGMEAAIHNADLIEVNIADDTLVAPKDGPIQYRLANVGEVLPAGGKVYTMLDVTYVYMDIFLPTRQAGQVKLGDDGSLALDALPGKRIPASVTFIAAQNEFTPKAVETQEERDKLMFRVRLRINPKLLGEHEKQVRSGLPGLAYIRLDSKVPWPGTLQPNLPQ